MTCQIAQITHALSNLLAPPRRPKLRFEYVSVSDTPGTQDVPAAISMTADQAPEAHRWKAVPPMQFHAPSSLQGVPAAYVPLAEPEPEPAEPVPDGAAALSVADGVSVAAVADGLSAVALLSAELAAAG